MHLPLLCFGEGNGTPLQYSCLEKSHGRRSLVGCSPCGREESDTTERLHFHFSLSCIGEGNGHPLQCSCLENPGDGGDWWAAFYGVAQSRTRLKWLSSLLCLLIYNIILWFYSPYKHFVCYLSYFFAFCLIKNFLNMPLFPSLIWKL